MDQTNKSKTPSQNRPKPLDAVADSSSSNAAVSGGGTNIKVICRIRPINQKELDLGNSVCVEFYDHFNIGVRVSSQGEGAPGLQKFAFDRVFDMSSTQEEVYSFGAKSAVESVLDGFNGTVFAYGQTSAGKTHTMQGKIDDPNLKGIIPRMVSTVFERIEESPEHIEFTVKVSIVEIYMEKIRDLISPEKNNLKVREDKARGIYIEDVTETSVASVGEVYELMRRGNTNRAVCATNMNEGSSRSHLVFIMSIHQKNTMEFSAKTGKLYLIDLAGSEKVGKTGAAGQTLQEAKDINKSLSVLGNVINALTDGKGGHIPYRDSKLTRILQESLGGNSKTTLIIACSPSSFNDQETLSTLRFGARAKSIKNKAKVNKELTVAELQVMLDKAEKNMLEQKKRIEYLESVLAKGGSLDPIEIPAQISEKTHDTEQKDQSSEVQNVSASPTDIKRNEDSEEDNSSEKEEDFQPKKNLEALLMNARDDESTRMKLIELQNELESEKRNLRAHCERFNALKAHSDALTMKTLITEEENEKLIYRLANSHLTINELEEDCEKLEEINSKAMAENEELKKANKLLKKQLGEKDEEISRLYKLLTMFNLEKKETPTKSKEEASSVLGTSTSSQSSDKIKKDLAIKVNEIAKRWLSEVTKKVKIAEGELFEEMGKAYRDRIKKVVMGWNFGGSDALEKDMQELKGKIAQLEQELVQQKNINEELKAEIAKVTEEYTRVLKEGIPNLEEIKQQAINNVLEQEKAKFEKDKASMIKELQRRLDKTFKLEEELQQEKDKSARLEQALTESESKSDAKMESLENSLNQLMDMVRNLNPESPIKRRLANSERKPKDKAERTYLIEKQLQETQELYVKLEKHSRNPSLIQELGREKSFSIMGVKHMATFSVSPTDFDQIKDKLKQEIQNGEGQNEAIAEARRGSITFSANPKIIKKIRGGNRKTLGNPQDFLKLLKVGDGNDSPTSERTAKVVTTPTKKNSENQSEFP